MRISYEKMMLLILTFLLSCKTSSGQGIEGDHVNILNTSNVVFYDSDLQDTVDVSGVVRVTFTDSLNLKPKATDITIFRMKGTVNFSYFYSKEVDLSDRETYLMKKYVAKIDSVFMKGTYQFEGDKKWILGNRLDFSYSFKILPK